MTISKKAQDAIKKTELTLKFSKEAINKNKKLLEKMQLDLAAAKRKNSQTQAKIDQDILDKVQFLDEETFKFVRSTE